MAGCADLTPENKGAIDKGASWAIILTIIANGVAFPLTNYIGKCQIRKTAKATDTTVLAAPTVTFPDAAGGKLQLSLTAAETDAIPTSGTSFLEPSKYVYDVEISNPLTGDVKRMIEGFVYVIPGVTR